MAAGNLFGVEPKAKRAKAPAVPSQAVQRMIVIWRDLFVAKFGEQPIVTGKDGAAAKRLLTHAPADVVERRLRLYLSLDDPYIAGQGYPLSLMLGAWNRLVAQDAPSRDRVPGASDTSDYLARMRSRHD